MRCCVTIVFLCSQGCFVVHGEDKKALKTTDYLNYQKTKSNVQWQLAQETWTDISGTVKVNYANICQSA